jgi:hypothetical protein
MRTARVARVVAAALAVAAPGCTPGPEVATDPVWGKEACGHCSMLVSEKPPAAQLTLADGTRKHFDDLGCMAAWLSRREDAHPVGAWVRQGEGWVPAAGARFSAGHATPMDFGFLAAREGVSWGEVQAAVSAKVQRMEGTP